MLFRSSPPPSTMTQGPPPAPLRAPVRAPTPRAAPLPAPTRTSTPRAAPPPSAGASADASSTGASPVAATVFPGTEGMFLMVVDSFVTSSSTDNRDSANAFLTTALDPQVETDFCKVKGCVPVRNDADVSSLTPYQQQTADALRSQTVLNSISYGEMISCFQSWSSPSRNS